jgi:molybdopterin molybdotransferase
MIAEISGRARHFTERSTLAAAAGWVDARTSPLAPEAVALDAAAGRILAADLAATGDLPDRDRAAADGFALCAAETVGAGSYSPAVFRLVEANDVPDRPDSRIGSAVRLAAGDALPAGTDVVVTRELAQETGDGSVEIIDAVAPGDNVERRGSQVRHGAALVASGRRLGPIELAALAATGVARVEVVRRPRVHLVAVAPAGAVHDVDGPLLRALVARDGGTIVAERRIGRERAAIAEAIAAADADLVLVTGGAGLGDNDAAGAALADSGELAIHGLALRPGGSLGIGQVGNMPVFLLPGPPQSCFWAYELVAGRAVRRLGGRAARLPYARRRLTVARKIVSGIGFAQICPVRLVGDDRVESTASFEEAGLFAAVAADGFVIVPEGSEGFPQGATVELHLFESGALLGSMS